MINKTKLFSFALLLALPFSLGGCNKAGSNPLNNKSVTLTYWGLFEKPETITPLIKKYQELHPNVTINYQPQSYTSLANYKELLTTRLKQEDSENASDLAPDIVRVHASWISPLSKYLTPIPASVYSSSDFSQTFYPVSSTATTVNSSIYGIPLMYDGLALIYNTDLFSEAGITSPPSTWEDFRSTAIKLTKTDPSGRLLQAGAGIGLPSNVAFGSDLLSLMWSQSGLKVPDDLETQAAADALTFYTNFSRQDKVWSDAFPNSVNAFAEGRVGMIFAPSWVFLDIWGLNPSIKMAATPVPQVPSLDQATTKVSWASFWVEAVPKTSANQDVAWDFLKFLSEKSQQQQFFSEAAKIRPFGEIYSRRDLRESLSGNQPLAAVVGGAESAVTAVTVDRSGNDEYVAAVNDAVAAVNAGTPEKIALTTCKKTLQQLLSRVR